MRIRQHNGFGHGLRPGETQDINCPSCQQERETNIQPTITGEDDYTDYIPKDENGYWHYTAEDLESDSFGDATPQAEYGITLEPLDGNSGIDLEDVDAFTSWLTDVLNTYDGPFRIETDF